MFVLMVEIYHSSEQRVECNVYVNKDFAGGFGLLSLNHDIQESGTVLLQWTLL